MGGSVADPVGVALGALAGAEKCGIAIAYGVLGVMPAI